MKIQLLRKRENFLEIFQKSILVFFQEKHSHGNYVNIEYVINDYLNIEYLDFKEVLKSRFKIYIVLKFFNGKNLVKIDGLDSGSSIENIIKDKVLSVFNRTNAS